ncbi:cytochrome c oxidase subunit 3 [Singulisphaera sp. GP187]|uniref:cytochrome c oxidase subunit 3 n=1 Tax=Singulisphaera sp. GP187 TaxID=1882752 RepID=UPI000928E9A9|nr:cytochrome c oxidase subunit 3 [Singulisphaera sp. GP187]SIO21914.1 cytochrome c oxidase subunit 3 [Singulisphaera sp. GP187]
MAHVADPPNSSELAGHKTPAARTAVQHPPVSPGKVAMWLFLATEIMFFTGLIGSYIVLRAGSPPSSFSNLFPPATTTDLSTVNKNAQGVILKAVGPNHEEVVEILERNTTFDKYQTEELGKRLLAIERREPDDAKANKLKDELTKEFKHEQAEHLVHSLPAGVLFGVAPEKAQKVHDELDGVGATTSIVPLAFFNWPKPYDFMTNPLSIDLTAANTFLLICSSVTMVFALSSFQRDERKKGTLWLAATTLIGAGFLSIQVYEYYQLMFGHHYPPGISATGHFRPSVSIFASCFFTMTGFHGAHVAGGVIMLACLTLKSALTGSFRKDHYSPVELVGLYWHFVDLVWILLFTVVYLI